MEFFLCFRTAIARVWIALVVVGTVLVVALVLVDALSGCAVAVLVVLAPRVLAKVGAATCKCNLTFRSCSLSQESV